MKTMIPYADNVDNEQYFSAFVTVSGVEV